MMHYEMLIHESDVASPFNPVPYDVVLEREVTRLRRRLYELECEHLSLGHSCDVSNERKQQGFREYQELKVLADELARASRIVLEGFDTMEVAPLQELSEALRKYWNVISRGA